MYISTLFTTFLLTFSTLAFAFADPDQDGYIYKRAPGTITNINSCSAFDIPCQQKMRNSNTALIGKYLGKEGTTVSSYTSTCGAFDIGCMERKRVKVAKRDAEAIISPCAYSKDPNCRSGPYRIGDVMYKARRDLGLSRREAEILGSFYARELLERDFDDDE